MKKSIRNFLVIILAVAAVICAAVGLAACKNGDELKRLSIEGAKIDFMIGDDFTLGDGCKIYAVYGDGSKKDVTAEAEIRKENGFDMNVPNDYQITVSYGGKREIYTIYVNDFTSVLRKIELNTETVKKQYALGEEISYDGLSLTLTYENAQGRTVISKTASLKNFDVEVKSENGTVIDEVFTTLGDYTVTVSQGNVKASYTVNVNGINISTVQSAIYVGKIFKTEVATGTQHVEAALHGGEEYFDEYNYDYKFGNNYTYLKNTAHDTYYEPSEEDPDTLVPVETTIITESHYSMDGEEIFCARFENGTFTKNPSLQNAMMNGAPNELWYLAVTEYGVEETLAALYKAGKEATNKDLEETANEATRTYSFKFSGLVNHGSIADYYETTVTFTLGAKYEVKSVTYTQNYWENNTLAPDGATNPSFVTDASGHTEAKKAFSKSTRVTVAQATGARTEANPYSKDMYAFQSFKLTYNGEDLGDNGTINCSMASPKLTINITDIAPSTADFNYDAMLFSFEGNRFGYQNSNGAPMGPNNGFMAYRTGNTISVTLLNGGKWVLLIKTANIEKSITFDVTGNAPLTMDAYVRNEASGNFYAGSTKIISLVGSVYFYGDVSFGADSSQTATVTSANAATATIEQIALDDITCFKFTATAAGEYTVKVTSTSNPSVYCEFTFTVSEAPDFGQLLNGEYTVTDVVGNVYDVTFTPTSSVEPFAGTVTVTQTPVSGEAKSQTFEYSVVTASMEIALVEVSGTKLGVDLSVNATGQLVLNDANANDYVLQPKA